MKKIVKAGLVSIGIMVSSNVLSAESNYPCDKPIVEAVSANGKKEVKICISGNGVSYTFGRVNEYDAELDIKVPFSQTGYNYFSGMSTFEIKRGNYYYTFRDGGTAGANLYVVKDRKQLANIRFGKVFTNDIYDMERFGIKDIGY